MVKFIVLTFGFLGWAFYEMSGGADFDPNAGRLTNIKVDPLKPASLQTASLDKSVEPAPQVTRVALNLTSVNDVLTDGGPRQATLPQQDVTAQKTEDFAQGGTVVILPSLIAGATPEGAAEPTNASAAQVTTASFETAADIRQVTASRVNVRGGPGTDFNIVGKLTRGTDVEILEDTGTGWVRFQALDGSADGWIADFLLSNG